LIKELIDCFSLLISQSGVISKPKERFGIVVSYFKFSFETKALLVFVGKLLKGKRFCEKSYDCVSFI